MHSRNFLFLLLGSLLSPGAVFAQEVETLVDSVQTPIHCVSFSQSIQLTTPETGSIRSEIFEHSFGPNRNLRCTISNSNQRNPTRHFSAGQRFNCFLDRTGVQRGSEIVFIVGSTRYRATPTEGFGAVLISCHGGDRITFSEIQTTFQDRLRIAPGACRPSGTRTQVRPRQATKELEEEKKADVTTPAH